MTLSKHTVHEIIRKPSKLETVNINDLRELVEEYPFFKAGHLLLALKGKEIASLDEKRLLSACATHTTSSTRLYQHFEPQWSNLDLSIKVDEENSNVEDDTHTDTDTDTDSVDFPDTIKDSIEAKVVGSGDSLTGIDHKEKIINDQLADDSNGVKSVYEDLLEKNSKELSLHEKLMEKEQEDEIADDLNLTIENSAEESVDLSQTEEKEQLEEFLLKTEEIPLEARLEVERELQEKLKSHQVELEAEDVEGNELSTFEDRIGILEKEINPLDIESDVQKDLDKLNADKTVENAKKSVEPDKDLIQNLKLKVDSYKKSKKTFDSWLAEYTGDDKSAQRPMLSNEDKEEISNVVGKDKKVDGFDNSSEQQIQDSINPVSETLAKVYARKGLYDEAISIYEQLIEQVPEKKVIFAAKIDELKTKK